jgi:uncharacterized protein (TIGR02678 family)
MSKLQVAKRPETDSRSIGLRQANHLRDEYCAALRALLMTPLMTAAHSEFAAVRRHANSLQDWFAREAGWPLQVGRDYARLYKRPGDLLDATRGLPGYDCRRYVLLCLACAVLERADAQITLRLLGDRLLVLAAEPTLVWRGFTFSLQMQHERHELVAVCRSLLDLGVLQRVAGDEDAYVRANVNGADGLQDALYDIHRRVLAGMLAAVRGPSTWPAGEAPVDFEERLRSLVAEHVPDNDEGHRTEIRHALSRRLLDDPVIYFDSLDADARTYFINQRGPMATRLADAAGMAPEQRAEGVALTDEAGTLTDIAMPAEGTEAHITLLVAELLAGRQNEQLGASQSEPETHVSPISEEDIAHFIASLRESHGSYWRKSAREPGSEHELARHALERLQKLKLIAVSGKEVRPLPALARFAAGTLEIIASRFALSSPSLFDQP